MATVNRDIKYLNRDFSDIRAKLIEFSKTYFPNTYNDISNDICNNFLIYNNIQYNIDTSRPLSEESVFI